MKLKIKKAVKKLADKGICFDCEFLRFADNYLKQLQTKKPNTK